MTPEVKRELVEAWNAGYCQTEPTVLERLRLAWLEGNAEERETFKAEIS